MLSCRTPSLLYTRSPGQATSTLPQTVRDAQQPQAGPGLPAAKPTDLAPGPRPMPEHAFAGPVPARPCRSPNRRRIPAHATPQPPRPRPPRARRAPARHKGRAGPRRTPASAIYMSKHRRKQGGAGPRAGFENPSAISSRPPRRSWAARPPHRWTTGSRRSARSCCRSPRAPPPAPPRPPAARTSPCTLRCKGFGV